MQQKLDPEIKLDRSGNPDIDFYIKEAKRLRTEAILSLLHDIAEWLRKVLGKNRGQPMRPAH